MQIITIPGAPLPLGHYSPAIVHHGLVYVSGQLPIDPFTGEHVQGDIEAQTERVLENLRLILESANSSLQQVLQVTIYTADMSLWQRINVVYARVFGDHRPARAVVPTCPLHYGLLIELSAIAATSSAALPDGDGRTSGSTGITEVSHD